MYKKTMRKLVSMITCISMTCAMALGISSCTLLEMFNSSEEHKCESVCPECSKCTDESCQEDACKDKCEGHTPVASKHECESECPECDKCTDAACTEDACKDKCEGHTPVVPKHECESECPECGKCTDTECADEKCSEKCLGHEVERANEYTQEAETVVCNGNVATGGDDQIWRIADSSASAGMYVAKIEQRSDDSPGKYYFKWSITADKADELDVYMTVQLGGEVNPSTAFPVKVNGEEVSFSENPWNDGKLDWSTWTTYKAGTLNLVEGENTVYIYIGTKAKVNLDYFTFKSDANLTFNQTAIDTVEPEKPDEPDTPDTPDAPDVPEVNEYLQEAETVVCNGNIATGGDDQIWRQQDSSLDYSGDFYLGRINDVAVSNPGYYYFKWSITASEACEVDVYISAGVSGGINSAVSFPAKLNGEDVTLGGMLSETGWTNFTVQKMGTINLKAGENIFYIYISTGASCNIDYFQFKTSANLTFNQTAIDTAEPEEPAVNEYLQEAETVACNGNVATGGDDQIWRQQDSSLDYSGDFYLGRINDVAVSNPGYYYFKWSITASETCEVDVYISAGVSGGINSAVSFPAKLNGEDVTLDGMLTETGWTNFTVQKMGTINLKAGENVFYIYIGAGASCNIDYFQFKTSANLTFNQTAIDTVEPDEPDTPDAKEYLQEAETVVCNGNVGTGGDDQIWRNTDTTRSGGMFLSRIGDVSVAKPGYYYFKWSITVEKACEVTVAINIGCGADIDVSKSFPAKLNGKDVTFSGTFPGYGWTDYRTLTLGTINLKAGENVFYIYIGEGALCNIDYFTFTSVETLTFNQTAIDVVAGKEEL